MSKIDTDKAKKIGLVALGGILLIVIGIFAFNFLKNQEAKETKDSPITKLEVTNDKVYKVTDKINSNDFSVKAIHKNGKETSIDSNDLVLSRTDLEKIGKETDLTLSLKYDKNITYDTSVKMERNKIVSFQCGYPKVGDVVATLYSNGELAFEGKGDTLIFADYEYPWLDYEESEDYPITSVSFGNDVTPSSLNYYFKGIETLTTIGKIPGSVQTMVGTFSECSGLKTCADWSDCTSLLDITSVYESCVSLTKTYPVPESVKKATSAFRNCTALFDATDLSKAKSLVDCEDMFANCVALSSANIAPNAKKIDGMYQSCINLKSMPKIPNGVESMNETFLDDLTLIKVTDIPKSVKAFDSAFQGCEMLSGTMKINCNVEESSNLFSGAVTVTELNLEGKSTLLDMYANTCDAKNVTVKGKKANEALSSISDYEREAELKNAKQAKAKAKKVEKQSSKQETESSQAKETTKQTKENSKQKETKAKK